MKKIYKKPDVAIEGFVSEEIMIQEQNALSDVKITDSGQEWEFLTGGSNVLNSINYEDFE